MRRRSKFSRRMERQDRIRRLKYELFTSFGFCVKTQVRGNPYVTVVTEVWQLLTMSRRFIFVDGDLCYIEKE